ncbi:MFS transporter [Streptomyces tsukubensis]|uniref:MFS transporter n=1 Tax=Streptomyces tsukubensis TaxID=83656 RepID=UPI00344CB90A
MADTDRDTVDGAGREPGRGRRWTMLSVLCLSLLMVALDATILNVALPSLIDDLEPDALQQLWIIDVYGLILGGLLITTAGIGDRYGRKRLFLAGVTLFGLASVLAATSDSSAQLIAGRVLLAIGGAMVMPSTLSLIRNIFHDPRERTLAIGVWAAVAGAGAAIGPLVGGVLVEEYGWSAAFWVNIPVVALTLAAGMWLLPEFKDPGHGRLDWVGALLSVAGIIALAWGIKHLAKSGLDVSGVLVLLAGLGLLALFARRQLTQSDPLLDVRLFRSRPFTAAAVATLLAMMAIGAALFLLSLWLQYVHGYSPSEAGLRTLPAALAALAGSLTAPWMMRHAGVRTAMATGLACMVAGFLVLALSPVPTPYPYIAVVFAALGIGDGLAITTAAAVLVSAVPAERAGQAGAVSETSYELGVGLGVALLGSVHAAVYASHMAGRPAAARESIGQAAELNDPTVLAAARTAFDSALTTTAWVSVGFVAAGTVLVAWLVPKDFTATSAH